MTTAAPLDSAFHALANATRRAVVERLGRGPASVTELAEPFGMALPSFMQHVRVLEESGLVESAKRGRVRTVRIVPGRFQCAVDWMEAQRSIWDRRLDQLDTYLERMEDDS